MGSICSKNKRKGSGDTTSNKSEGSNKKSSIEGLENHSNRRPSQQNGKGQAAGAADVSTGPTTSTATAADTPESSLQKKDSLRSRLLREAEPSSVSGDSMSLSSPTTIVPQGGGIAGGRDSGGELALPMEMKKQSENVRHLLTGRVGRVKPVTKCRKITLYICASDSQDFRLEKGNLHTEVYPALREYCTSKGYELHITDLHWKTDLENKQDHEFPELCLGELKRQQEVSYIVPVLFLSNSLGAPLLPKTVEQQDFEMALKNVGDVTDKALVEKWYCLDSQAQPPCYRLRPISTHIPQIQSKIEAEKVGGINEWRGIVEQILSIMLRVFPNELRDTYLTTVIEQEIHNSIFMSREVGKRSIWACRVFTHFQAASQDSLTPPIDMEKTRRLEALHNELKNQLVGSHILRLLVKWKEGGLDGTLAEHTQYLVELSAQLSTQLRSILDEIIEEDRSKAIWKSCYGVEGSLCSEVMQQTMFCQQAAKCSLSIENLLNDIKSYIGSQKTSPLVLHGPKGCGKTSFLSRVIQQASMWFPDTFLIYRFVGLTPESRSLLQLLRTITSQFDFLGEGKNYWIPHNVACYVKELYRKLSKPTPVLIVIDGLDKLSPDDVSELSWLSRELPARMKMIVSCEDESSVFQSLLTQLEPENTFLSMSPLSTTSAESMLSASILQFSHSVDSDVQRRLCSQLKNCTHPLYIKVLSWRASIDTHGTVEVSGLTDVGSAINELFDYLEKSLGKEKVESTLALMCASHFGLCDSELLDLLAYSPSFCSAVTFVDWAPASLFLAQLFQRLGPFLEWGLSGDAVVIGWRDTAFFETAKKRYLGSKVQEKKIRQLLLSYFQEEFKDKKNGRSVSPAPGTTIRHTRRKLEEVPYQHFHVKGSILKAYVCNVDWLVQKIQISSVYNVLEDISLEQTVHPENPDLMLLRQTLELSAGALSYSGSQFFGQMFGRLLPYFEGEGSGEWKKRCPFINTLFELAQTPKIPSFIPISDFLHSQSPVAEDEGATFAELDSAESYFSEFARIKSSNQFIVSLSTAKEEVKVWDVYKETPVRTLQGIPNPSGLTAIDEQRSVILSGRELHVYNLDDGTFLSKLKGVMNQKMPFYGLHDANHIVSLSRNRMYVNLMKVDTGDMVTTFKVGEDRFLNSLIVSENGKFLVCGDETQKPFPLLVWDLTSRKLLYDLRIPHHEFITSMSAITKEGNFVCCICKEVDDSSGPNHIVVYDLQSGTLFKKWKPGYNTQAIAISAQGGCVINAIEDNRILVWDLTTGTCQWSLQKHTAPVDILRLDQKGARCLSCDSNGRDRSVCLWDLSNGTLLALFTPDVPFTACEVFNNGDGVVLGLRGKNEIVTLLYRDNVSVFKNREDGTFGTEKHHCLITNFKNP